ncbi:MAG: FmdB family zinc ribbon protein [Sphaerochaetaceae bacterium]|jgi:putative FmdB family regulatory protein
MPIYEYVCDSCKKTFDVEQRMSDEPLTVCTECKGRLRRVFNSSPIIFKGGGFYATDSRKESPKEESVGAKSS